VECATHADQAVELFCNDCQQLICTKCGSYEHKTHDYVPIIEESPTSAAMVMASAVPVVHEFGSVKEALDRARQMLAELDVASKEAEIGLDTMFRDIQRAVIARQGVVKGAFEAEVAKKRGLLAASIQVLDNQQSHFEESLGFVNRTLTSVSGEALLCIRQTLVTGLARLERHGLMLTPPCTSEIEVDKTAAYDAALLSIGQIGSITNDVLEAIV
jgi:hypothetical protein